MFLPAGLLFWDYFNYIFLVDLTAKSLLCRKSSAGSVVIAILARKKLGFVRNNNYF
jgi:hypothetical protein